MIATMKQVLYSGDVDEHLVDLDYSTCDFNW